MSTETIPLVKEISALRGKIVGRTLTKIEANCADSGSPKFEWLFFECQAMAAVWAKNNNHRIKPTKISGEGEKEWVPSFHQIEGERDENGDYYIRDGKGGWSKVNVLVVKSVT